jgi:NTE family protein
MPDFPSSPTILLDPRFMKTHLILGSGGARGIAHIGIIEELERQGFEIISVSGCSIGAVVGGVYAAGALPEYKSWMLSLTKSKVFGLMDFTLEKQGFLKGERVFEELQKRINSPLIEEFRIPFAAVATDLISRQEIWFRSGDLYKALRASVAIPGIITPVKENNQLLVDGAVLNPIPLNAIQKKEDEIIVAVNLYGVPKGTNKMSKSESDEIRILKNIRAKLYRFSGYAQEAIPKRKDQYQSIQDLLYISYQLTRDRLIELMLAKYPPDLYISVPSDSCSLFDFHKSAELIEIGRSITSELLQKEGLHIS